MNSKYFLILIPVILYFFYIGNIKPWMASRAFVSNNIEESLNHNTFINHEARKALAQQAANGNDLDLILFSIKEMEKNIKERPLDVKSYILLSYLYYRLGDEKANKTIDIAQKLAPNQKDVKELDKIRVIP